MNEPTGASNDPDTEVLQVLKRIEQGIGLLNIAHDQVSTRSANVSMRMLTEFATVHQSLKQLRKLIEK